MTRPVFDLTPTNDIAAIERAAKAIVYLYVEWSVPERFARQVVLSALDSMRNLDFEFYSIEEDGAMTRPWLEAHGWGRFTTGYGSLLWFEAGRCIAKELVPGQGKAEKIVEKTKELWEKPNHASSTIRATDG